MLQTIQALLPAGAPADEANQQEAASRWGQAQGMSLRSAAAFARSYGA